MKWVVHDNKSKDGSTKTKATGGIICVPHELILINVFLNVTPSSGVDSETKELYLQCDEKSKMQMS